MLVAVRSAPAAELLASTGLALLAVLAVGPRPLLIGLLWLAIVTPRLVATDALRHCLPDRVVLPGYPVVLAAVVADSLVRQRPPGPVVLAGLASGLLLLLLHEAGGMGLGDVKLVPLTGMLADAVLDGGALLALLAAFLLGGVAAAVLLVRRGPRTRMPFGPPLLLGAWTAIVLLA